MSGLGIEPSFARNDLRGAKAPTNRPGSYEGLRRRPQFYRAEGGALIRNVFLPGRGSIFPCPLAHCVGGAFLLTGDPLQCFHVVCVAWGRGLWSCFWPRFLRPWGFEPPDDASERVGCTDWTVRARTCAAAAPALYLGYNCGSVQIWFFSPFSSEIHL